MGSTLPVLGKHLTRTRAHIVEQIGMLYGLNTLGGAVGCALVGFVSSPLLGLSSPPCWLGPSTL